MEIHPMIKTNLSGMVKQYLYDYIKNIDENSNMKLPPETEISGNLGVSRITVRRALDELEKEGIVLRIHGRGTFVNPEAINIQVNLMPGEEFSNLSRSCGYTPSFEIHEIRKVKADLKIARILQLEQDEEIFEIEKIFKADGHPAIISIDRFATKLVDENLRLEDIKSQSNFDFLRQKSGCIIARDKIQIETKSKNEVVQIVKSGKLMECESMLVFHGVNYNQENQPIVYDTELYDTNFIKFNLLRIKNLYKD